MGRAKVAVSHGNRVAPLTYTRAMSTMRCATACGRPMPRGTGSAGAVVAAMCAATCLVSTVFAVAPTADCPRGATHLRTIEPLPGACAVAFDGASLLACVPDATGAGEAEQVVRVDVETGEREAVAVEGVFSASDVARAASGALAVVDLAGRVLVDGRPLGDGALVRPVAAEWVGDGLAVSDAALGVVVVLAPDGAVRARLGDDALVEPAGLALAPDGALLVADRLGDCLWRFDAAEGAGFDATPTRIGERGVGPGQFHSPRDVAVVARPGGWCLAVADELNHRIQILDPVTGRADFFGMHALVPRQGEGRIHYPVGVAASADGTVLAVAEAFEDRVQLMALKSEPDEVDPTAGSLEYISSHFGGECAAGAGMLGVVDVETQSVALLDARSTPPIHISIVGGNGALPARFGEISAVAIDEADGRVYIADRVRARLDVIATDWNREGLQRVDMFIPRLARGMDLALLAGAVDRGGARRLARTPDVVDMLVGDAAGAPGRLLLLDAANMGLIRCDTRLGGADFEPLPGGARSAVEFARDADGAIAVADPVGRRVHVLRADGSWESLEGLGAFAFERPAGVAFLGDGAVAVADRARDACVVGVPGTPGEAVLVGERGGLDEQFFAPESIAPTSRGWIVIDRGNHRFQRFAASGADRFAWNMTGGLGRYYDRKRRGSPGATERREPLPPPTPVPAPGSAPGEGAP